MRSKRRKWTRRIRNYLPIFKDEIISPILYKSTYFSSLSPLFPLQWVSIVQTLKDFSFSVPIKLKLNAFIINLSTFVLVSSHILTFRLHWLLTSPYDWNVFGLILRVFVVFFIARKVASRNEMRPGRNKSWVEGGVTPFYRLKSRFKYSVVESIFEKSFSLKVKVLLVIFPQEKNPT